MFGGVITELVYHCSFKLFL